MKISHSLITVIAVSALAGCQVGYDDADEQDIGSTEISIEKGNAGARNGVGDYCDDSPASAICNAGEGDCDFDKDCQGVGVDIGDPVVCGQNNGLAWGMHEIYDVCVATHCTDGMQNQSETGVDCGGNDCGTCFNCPAATEQGTWNFCTAGCQCSANEGDCDNNSHCAGSLVCGTNNGGKLGLPATLDVCVNASCPTGSVGNGGGSWCTDTCPCGPKNGDCDRSSHCINGSVCGTDNGPRFGFSSTTDVCVVPHCTNGVQDGDETAIDCGAAGSDCGGC